MKVLDCLPTMADVMEGAAPLLRVAGLSHAFGGQQVLKDVAVELRPGEVVVLRGANGSGKTTLLNILTGNLVPDRGDIELNSGKNAVRFEFPLGFGVRGFSPEGLARLGLGRTWQDVRLFDTQSLANNIAVATPRQLGGKGVYVARPDFHIVVHKLLATPETLWFRLMGWGKVQQRAMAEVAALPENHVHRTNALNLLLS